MKRIRYSVTSAHSVIFDTGDRDTFRHYLSTIRIHLSVSLHRYSMVYLAQYSRLERYYRKRSVVCNRSRTSRRIRTGRLIANSTGRYVYS